MIAYFTWADNTVVENTEEIDVDASTSASVLAPGNAARMVSWIQEETGGDLFSIQVTEPYSSDYDECLDRASEELLGFGVFQITDEAECEKSVLTALQTGYRLIDTAACYGNERAVGKAIKESGIPRNEIFISSKVWIQDAGYEATRKSFEKTLKNLQTDYLDLYLIHMPYGDYYGSWRAMEELYKEGKIRAIGVCNFEKDRLVDLILNTEIVPAINQMETHPFCQQKELRKVMEKYEIRLMAWAPFAEGRHHIFANETLSEIGQKYQKTPAQVVLRWLRQEGIIAIPKSVHEERIAQNFAVDDFSLTEGEMQKVRVMDLKKSDILEIRSLDEVYRLYNIRFEQ